MRFPVTNSATARRSAPLSLEPCGRIAPVISASRMASGARERSASRAGARESAAPLWQLEQLAANSCAPSGACATTGDAARMAMRAARAVVKRCIGETLLEVAEVLVRHGQVALLVRLRHVRPVLEVSRPLDRAGQVDRVFDHAGIHQDLAALRSEERRVGKEC